MTIRADIAEMPAPSETTWRREREERFHWLLYTLGQPLRGRPVANFIRQFQAWERLDAEAFGRLTRARLADALTRARTHVPLYSTGPWQTALRNAHPTDIRSWPMLDRDTVEQHVPELIARPAPSSLFFRTTSGSTGRPLRFALNPVTRAWDLAALYRGWFWHDISPVARTLRLFSRGDGPFYDWVLNRRVISLLDLTHHRLEAAARTLLTWRPTLLWSFPSAAFQLARYIRETRPAAGMPIVPYVVLGGEQVFPFQRRELEQSLGAQVIEAYGASESAMIAMECPAGSMHVHADHVYVEILRDGEPVDTGQIGDIVITPLANYAMPYVRYRVGDMGRLSPEPCPCGRPLPVLTDLTARSTDLLLSADGRRLHGSALTAGLDDIFGATPIPAVRQVLFEQVNQRTWRVLVEAGQGLDDMTAARFADLVRRTFGAECMVTIERVAIIPREASGKFRYYRSRLNGQPGASPGSLPASGGLPTADHQARP